MQTHKLTRSFHLAGQDIHALWEVSLQVEAGTLTLFRGPSGSGKTTLLNLLAGLDEPTRGTIHLGDYRLTDLSPQQKNELRRQQIGFVFQTFGLLPFLSVRENVELPLRMLDIPGPERSHRLQEALDIVGLRERADHRTYELSGGEQQRVAIARAIVKRPRLILADEPTGQLDSVTGARIINLLRQIVSHTGITVIVASHDPNVMEKADKQWELQDGKLVAVDEP